MNQSNEIPEEFLWTPQEYKFLGASFYYDKDTFYTPVGVRGDLYSIEEINGVRQAKGFTRGALGAVESIFDLDPTESLLLRFQPIDLQTGQTIKDPEIVVGVLKDGKVEVKRSITAEYCKLAGEENLHLRKEGRKNVEDEQGKSSKERN
jgi:hypothetical protein